MELPSNPFFQERDISNFFRVGPDDEAGLVILRPEFLLNPDQNGLIFHYMKAVVFRRKSLPGGNPDIGSVLRKMAKRPCAAGQIVGPFHEKLKFHFFPR
jgi:hypothetical protein